MNYLLDYSSNFLAKEIDEFKKILMDAGEVKEKPFKNLIKQNPILLFYPNTFEIKGIGALKIPNKAYKEKVFKNSKSGLSPKNYKYELGWVVSLIEEKGVGTKIASILAQINTSIYATVRENNFAMRHILTKVNFEKRGSSFKSDRGDYDIILFVKKI